MERPTGTNWSACWRASELCGVFSGEATPTGTLSGLQSVASYGAPYGHSSDYRNLSYIYVAVALTRGRYFVAVVGWLIRIWTACGVRLRSESAAGGRSSLVLEKSGGVVGAPCGFRGFVVLVCVFF